MDNYASHKHREINKMKQTPEEFYEMFQMTEEEFDKSIKEFVRDLPPLPERPDFINDNEYWVVTLDNRKNRTIILTTPDYFDMFGEDDYETGFRDFARTYDKVTTWHFKVDVNKD
jgi:hypothetical protein